MSNPARFGGDGGETGPSAALLAWPARSTQVEVRRPTALLPASSRDPEDFERVWRLLPESRVENRIARLEEEGDGLFVKGQQPSHRGRSTPPWRRARLLREARTLPRLAGLGLPVPELVAWGEERRAGAIARSFLVLGRVPGAVGLDVFLCDPTRSPAERRQVLESAGRVLARLHEVDLFHRNLSARNLLVRPGPTGEASGPGAWMIDCPRAEECHWGPRRSFLRRADFYRMARSVARVGASADELGTLLVAAGAAPEESAVIARQLQVPGAHRELPWRTNLWLMLGLEPRDSHS